MHTPKGKTLFITGGSRGIGLAIALKAAAEGPLKGVLAYCDEPLVSKDFNGNANSSIVDALSTMVMEGTMVKVVSWYDNEWGYSNRVVDLIAYMAKKGL